MDVSPDVELIESTQFIVADVASLIPTDVALKVGIMAIRISRGKSWHGSIRVCMPVRDNSQFRAISPKRWLTKSHLIASHLAAFTHDRLPNNVHAFRARQSVD